MFIVTFYVKLFHKIFLHTVLSNTNNFDVVVSKDLFNSIYLFTNILFIYLFIFAHGPIEYFLNESI